MVLWHILHLIHVQMLHTALLTHFVHFTQTTPLKGISTLQEDPFPYKYIHFLTYKKSESTVWPLHSKFIDLFVSIYHLQLSLNLIFSLRFLEVMLDKAMYTWPTGWELVVSVSMMLYGRLAMSRFGGGPSGLQAGLLALSSNIITLKRERKVTACSAQSVWNNTLNK